MNETPKCPRCGRLLYDRNAEMRQLMHGPMACNRDQADASLPANCTCPTRVLTVLQPWARAIAEGRKTIETRTQCPTWRGILFIHAAKSTKHLTPAGRLGFTDEDFGGIIAVATLADIRPFRTSDEAASCGAVADYAWVLENVRKIPQPRAFRGRQGLWRINDRDALELRQSAVLPERDLPRV